jgi:zinc/manganese transport system substrate-binding protein
LNRLASIAIAAAFALISRGALAAPISVVAAENFYGEAAQAVGGDHVAVQSVLLAPGTDPHDYDPPASVATAVADADLVILNGADYDHWMAHLLDASAAQHRAVIDVASLIGVKGGDNPHIWYDPDAMPAAVNAVADALAKVDPAHAADYAANRDAYLATLAPIAARVGELRDRFAGAPAAATEPVFGYMADALGIKMQNEAFQTAIMNETEPAARDVAAVEDALRKHEVKVLFYNPQVEDSFTKNLAAIANAANVPIVAVSETMPDGKSFVRWQLDTLEATAAALEKGST